MSSAPHISPCTHQAGFSLIEVLVTIIILSIGMLGSAGMQAAALQANTQTRYQVVAAALAGELAEAMRGNHRVALNTLPTANPYLIDHDSGALVAPPVNCRVDTCSGNTDAQRLSNAQWQVHEWMGRLQSELPSPRVRICFDSTPFHATTGAAEWDCDDTGDVLVAKIAWTRINTKGTLIFGSAASSPLVVIPVTAGSAS
ncbi:type IV pilus modification protein PilV [Hydrogenophaga sp.]|uniref:type IV pilus modification protein PilV n=1 Tax=Hydrogenophaga sp. TaxID=1904254 RepID=UPI0025C3361B|nr:type IV pilus modification protein PilV [Hydrogenophaga sp.]MBT9464951.1 type IV pilus modification protein PilV [Hydrogenophaga sp.]